MSPLRIVGKPWLRVMWEAISTLAWALAILSPSERWSQILLPAKVRISLLTNEAALTRCFQEPGCWAQQFNFNILHEIPREGSGSEHPKLCALSLVGWQSRGGPGVAPAVCAQLGRGQLQDARSSVRAPCAGEDLLTHCVSSRTYRLGVGGSGVVI